GEVGGGPGAGGGGRRGGPSRGRGCRAWGRGGGRGPRGRAGPRGRLLRGPLARSARRPAARGAAVSYDRFMILWYSWYALFIIAGIIAWWRDTPHDDPIDHEHSHKKRPRHHGD